MNEKYDEAVALYNKAFQFKLPFILDLKNAKYALARSSMDSAAAVGLILVDKKRSGGEMSDKERIENWEALIPNIKDKSYWKYVPEILKGIEPQLTYIEELTYQLDSVLFKKDQAIRLQENAYSDENKPKRREVDSINLVHFMQLMEQYGMISEFNTTGSFAVEILSIHCTEWSFDNWIPMLYKMVRAGLFSNSDFANIIDRYQTVYKANADSKDSHEVYAYDKGMGFYNCYLVFDTDDEELETINKYHAQILLEPFQDMERKKLWLFEKNIIGGENDFVFHKVNSFCYYFKDETDDQKIQGKACRDQFLGMFEMRGAKYKIYKFGEE